MNAADATPPAPRPRRAWLGKSLLALAGLAAGLGVAELVFRLRDDAGFPKLNVYIDDEALGVRLDPGAWQRLVYPDNPTTSVRINRQGYRGADWPAPQSDDDILVVGDSQVFGLGVEENETFATALGQTLKRRVLNGGVPTYGPAEYAQVAREVIAARAPHPPRTVIFTINMVNDLFEAARPNRQRHAVRDGWAVRSDAAPDVIGFPGRSWLARRSHLFYALRSLIHEDTDGQSRASEGTWKDLIDSGARAAQEQQQRIAATAERASERRETEAALRQRATQLDETLISLLYAELSEDERNLLEAAHSQPGDYVLVHEPGLEEGRAVQITADQIRRGAALRTRLRARAEELARRARPELRQLLQTGFEEQPKLAARLDELGLAHVKAALDTPVAPAIRALKQACDEAGVRLVLLLLPIDVSVSADEWKKYGAAPRDMSGAMALHDEIVALGAELGLSTLDATAALRAAEPGAFLNHDIHMTPRGHAAVAAALAQTLAAPPPAPPVELSPMPVPSQWNAVGEIVVAGSTAARCETKRLREWMRILCLPREYGDVSSAPLEVKLVRNQARQALALVMPTSTALTLALAPGDELEAELTWKHAVRRFTVRWAAEDQAPKAAFAVVREDKEPPRQYGRRDFDSDAARTTCKCWDEVYPSQGAACPGIYGRAEPGCMIYSGDCPRLVACALLDPASPPSPPDPASPPSAARAPDQPGAPRPATAAGQPSAAPPARPERPAGGQP